ncbi:MAG: NAD(P)-dependent alcohol dehydrogenase [Sphingopyxis macrogoltabida]|uniref:NAD(P)-dependent alcohol dehydrogenase n=1 Tax=Sphingopyxis macrogoltabida TaxID=33050 RepID=A0A2W5L2P6_SPHMC|nr:MAG: NAD(P)-dependent alcohol dehydrogenase [Sphingopyxis macrogoltabida]
MKIQAALARTTSGPFTIETLELDDPRPDEIRVRIVGVGVCHTDLVALGGGTPVPLPAVFGHEGAGVVEAIGSAVTKVAVGDHVVLTFRSCGSCRRCQAGDPAYCADLVPLNYGGGRSDGISPLCCGGAPVSGAFFSQSSFATHALAYERNVVKVPKSAPLWQLGPLGCGVQTGAGAAMNALACEAGSSLLIIGGGSVGLSALMGGVVQGCARLLVVEPFAERRELALALGATDVIDPAAEPDIAAAVRARLPMGVDYALDTTGKSALLDAALDALAKRGVLGVLGIPAPDTPTPGKLAAVMRSGLTIRGIVEGDSDPDIFIPRLVELFLAGRLPIDRITTRYDFADINQAIADQHAGRCVKIILTHDAAGAD